MSSRKHEKQASAREKAARLRADQLARERRQRRLLGGGAIALVLLAVVALVVAKVAGVGSSPPASATSAADQAIVAALRTVPTATFDKIGVGTAQGAPSSISAPRLTQSGKPRVLYIGAEYCPYCAAERWPMALALSRFGTFTHLGVTESASEDVFPNTPTLSFHGVTYTSPYLSFTGVETTSNKKSGGGYAPLDTPTAQDQKVFDTYNQPPYVQGQGGAIPFIDIGGTYVSAGATYSPQLLAGKTQRQVAQALADPTSDITRAVGGSANLFTAAICTTTGGKPDAVCTSPGVTAAAAHLAKK